MPTQKTVEEHCLTCTSDRTVKSCPLFAIEKRVKPFSDLREIARIASRERILDIYSVDIGEPMVVLTCSDKVVIEKDKPPRRGRIIFYSLPNA